MQKTTASSVPSYRSALIRLVFAGIMLALAMYLPFLTGQIPAVGAMLSPMHIPAFLTGFVCGPVYGLVVGAVSPLLRSLLFGMPPLFPTAAAMAFELAAYGVFAGLLTKLLPRKPGFVYVSLVVSMLAGRAVWGVVMFAFSAFFNISFGVDKFLTGAFISAWPGIVLHLVIIPPVVIALRKAVSAAGIDAAPSAKAAAGK